MATKRSARSIEGSRRASNRAKARRTGVCVDCGAETRYAGAPGRPVSIRCASCARAIRAKEERGTGPRQMALLEALRERGEVRWSDVQEITGVSREAVGQLVSRLHRAGLIVRVSRGVYRLPVSGNGLGRDEAGGTFEGEAR